MLHHPLTLARGGTYYQERDADKHNRCRQQKSFCPYDANEKRRDGSTVNRVEESTCHHGGEKSSTSIYT